jgi:hypothetical protein
MSSLQTIFERKLIATFPEPHQRKGAFSKFPHFEDMSEDMRYRVWLAILKLSEGNQDKLATAIEAATEDPKDAIEWAERPFSWKARIKNQFNEKESSDYDLQDWAQYVSWLL